MPTLRIMQSCVSDSKDNIQTNPDYFVVPSRDLEGDFVKKGIDRDKLLAFGIPVREAYTKEYNEED